MVTMILTRRNFTHSGLADAHFGISHPSIPAAVQPRCQRLTDSIESAVRPEDLDLAGNGYRVSGDVHSVSVDGYYRITYEWIDDHGHNIDFV